ncbi:hypothetical protein [Streptomyces sp. NPDC017529]|uniref:hypothetical protein n=1 Tax=Streptomyces sp. NPDC017529 TaxID=3365000 RepID=UPI0037AF8F5E
MTDVADPTTLHLAADKNLQVTFASQDQPALDTDTYTLAARQPVKDGTTTLGTLAGSLSFAVHAPRFTLEPADVTAVHPPPTGHGDFGLTLPHLVLSHSTLPWARPLGSDKQTPWQALILVTDDDVLLDSHQEAVTARTVKDLLKPPATVLAPALDPKTGPVPAEKIYDRPCRTLDLRADAVTDVLPRLAELRWLAHVRDVALHVQRTSQDTFTPGRRAVLFSNRFPRLANRRYTAALVSLEGYAGFKFLAGNGTEWPTGKTAMRLAVLWSWSFTTSSGNATNSDFHALAQDLATASRGENLLRLPHTSGSGAVAAHVTERLRGGCVPVTYRLPSGEHTPAWYRGPFTARPARTLPTGRTPFTSAETALVYLKNHGVWDVGHACAFTRGQLLAAANPSLLRALAAYRIAGLDTLRTLHRTPDTALTAAQDARTRFQALVNADLAQKITSGLEKPDPPPSAVEPGRTAANGHHRAPRGAAAGLDRAVQELCAGTAAKDGARAGLAGALRAVADDHAAEVAGALGEPQQWMMQVPFDHLVPHAAMLPAPAARFFHIDAQWMRAMFDGMRSTGAVTRLDVYLDRLLDDALAETFYPQLPVFGGLIRSPLVRYWPELMVEVTHNGAAVTTYVGRPLPDVMLLLCDKKQPDRIVLREPPHGLSMGFHTSANDGSLNLRRPSGTDIGKGLDAQATGLNACKRGTSDRAKEVLRIAEGTDPVTSRVQAALRTALGDTSYQLTPAGLALQLLGSAGQLELTPTKTPPPQREEATP